MEQTFHQNKSWIYRAVMLLSFNGGFVNAITFESFFHNPVGYVTGNFTFAASYLYEADIVNFIGTVAAVFAFLVGAILSGLIVPHDDFVRNRRYNFALELETLFIITGMVGLIFNVPTSKYWLAIALGVQNGTTTFYGKSIIRTTHMTGTMTDLGISLAHKIINKSSIPTWRILIYIYLLLGFFIGSICGIVAFKQIGYYGLIFSILVCIIMIRFKVIKLSH